MTDPTPSKGIARYDGPRTVADLEAYSRALAFDRNPEGAWKDNAALPVAFRGNPAAIAFATEYGKAIDVSPVTAIMGIHFIDGKPSASAGLISALVRRAGHRIRTWVEGSVAGGDLVGITEIVRTDDPDFTYRSEWSLERAVRAGLCTMTRDPESGRWSVTARGRSGKPGGWETYTENMAKARSITEAARDGVEDALLGVHYTPEELGAEVTEAGEPVYSVTQVPATPAAQPAAPEPEPQPQPEPSAEATEDKPAPAADDTPAEPTRAAPSAEEIDALRDQILAATDAAQLADLWADPDGLIRASTENARSMVCGDENHAETTILELMRRAGTALARGSRLTPEPVEAHDPWAGDPAATGQQTPDAAPPADEGDEGDDVPMTSQDRIDAAVEAVRTASSRDASTMLDNVMIQFPHERAEIMGWARAQGLDPRNNPEAASQIVRGIAEGDAFTEETLRRWVNNPVRDSFLTVVETLDANPLSRTPAQEARDEIRRNRS